jgi:hypothetical protein
MNKLSRSSSVLLGVCAIVLFAVGFHVPQQIRTSTARKRAPQTKVPLAGKAASEYFFQTNDGQSLTQALTAVRFGLQWQEHAPGDSKTAGGYLGMSHEQGLSAWFADNGVTVRPTLPEKKRELAWSTALRLKACGYGKQLADVPPVVSRQVKENRIEYQHGIVSSSQPLTEWYENRAEGIEQGFTLNERPERGGVAPNEPLRMLLAVTGDLRARTKDEGNIELVDEKGNGALSYSKLRAQDADGKLLAARMEVSANGREIALMVEDAGARYPIVIDPLLTSLEQKLRSDSPQLDARFGFAVAIDGNMAVVGAWREDVGPNADVGAVYVFIRSGSAWALDTKFGPTSIGGQQCGYSVAINGNRIVYGCPGDNGGKGTAFFFHRIGPNSYAGVSVGPGGFTPGDRFGASVAISGNMIVVGSPGEAYNAEQNAGSAWFSTINADGTLTVTDLETMDVANAQIGTSVAIDSVPGQPSYFNAAIGIPGIGAGEAELLLMQSSGGALDRRIVTPSDGSAGDEFGQSVAVSGFTAVIGAPFNRDRGANAGAAYVFVRDNNAANWNQQQKLLGSDAYTDGDVFGAAHIAILADTIAVGASGWEPTNNINDEYGKAYIFTRTGTLWTEQAVAVGDNHVADQFGIALGLSGDTLIVGANVATAVGTARAGAAFVYRLPHTLANISTRLRVETGDNVLIGGFIITGSQPKKIIVRAIGPSLPFADKLADPILELYQGNTLLESNDNWMDSPNKQAIIDSTIPPNNPLESAIVRTLAPGSYTAIVRGVNNGTGIGVVEVYDLNTAADSKLANISTRGLVQGGDNVLIAGTIVVGQGAQNVIIRALGPSVPVPGRLGDPTLELRDGNGTLLEANDNWKDSPNKQAIIDSTVAPTNDLESAIVRTLAPAPYTAIVRGVGGTPGIGVVEVYALP